MRLAIVGTAVVGGIAIVSSSVYASLNAQTYNTAAQAVSTDTLKLTMASSTVAGLTGGVTTPIANVAPGDIVNRFLDLSNTGTMAGSTLDLMISATVSTALTSNSSAGLQIAIFECATDWTTVSGLCSGTAGTQVMASTPATTLVAGHVPVTVSSLASGATNHLRLQLTLPAGSEVTTNGVLPVGTVQGLTSNLTWTFTEVQRAAQTTQN
jgi:hypothetical protein